ncbi:MAG: S1 RNA-binding domain-containing protein [Chloroflexota bacterium]|nr:S1 RNA-binding domain-containing protein [Chloroflexota bacterium]MDE2686905.1 S1 RNA-binding domain-containing protein [Chloroflexota bacterium]MYC07034.1 S1 RNA-binding domain-containing protein [Chloroflexota bacterium]
MTSESSSDDSAIMQNPAEEQEAVASQAEPAEAPVAEATAAAPQAPEETPPPPVTEAEVSALAYADVDDDDAFDFEEDEESDVQDMGQLLDSMEPIKPLRRGEVVDGEVMGFSEDGGILVNIGHKSEGVVQQREMRSLSEEEYNNLGIGDKIITYVLRPESADNAAILSIDRALGETGWRELEKCLEDNETVEGSILGFNKGGAIVDVRKVQGFVPMSQLVSVPRDIFRDRSETEEDAEAENRRMERQAEETGKTLQLKILEINRSRNRAIFSERQAVQEWRDAQKARLVEELQVGETRKGVVTGISSFGAFVDLGGADGLVHISEMSWGPVAKPEDVVSIGDELDVFVLRVDIENKKIALSLRRLEPEPWETIHERLHVDDIVDAQITKLTNFGAFARVEGNIEGLIHISELSDRVIGHPREVVQEGEDVKLKVLRIEPERRRLGLSLKQTMDNPFLNYN